jgi:hypothetical protein
MLIQLMMLNNLKSPLIKILLKTFTKIDNTLIVKTLRNIGRIYSLPQDIRRTINL